MGKNPVTVDAKDRLSIPSELRDELGIEPGDMLFVEREDGTNLLRYTKAANPFDVLANVVANEFRAGKTKNARGISRELGMKLG